MKLSRCAGAIAGSLGAMTGAVNLIAQTTPPTAPATTTETSSRVVNASHDGTLVSLTGDKLVMVGEDGKEHSHAFATDAKLTLDGKDVKFAQLVAGTRIRVTTNANDAKKATRIEGIGAESRFATNQHDGVLVSVGGTRLVMKADASGKEQSSELTSDVQVTCDGNPCKLPDLKAGNRVRVTTRDAWNSTAVRIEALDKSTLFASPIHDGKIVSMTDQQLVLGGAAGTPNWTGTLNRDVAVTRDNKNCTLADLKPGTLVRVTTAVPGSNVVIHLETLDRNTEFASNLHEGELVSVTGRRLVMTGLSGQAERKCTLTGDALITCDGERCLLSEIKPAARIRVTTENAFSPVATGLDALLEDDEFSAIPRDGLVVSVSGEKLVLTCMQTGVECSCPMGKGVKLTCDGADCKWSDLKQGMRVRVTGDGSETNAAVRIEALDKNRTFATTSN